MIDQEKENLRKFLKNLMLMIEQDATGYDMAYEIERNGLKQKLNHDGIIFYDTFLKIGDKKVNDIPNEEKRDYKSFKTIEDSHKKIFIEWANQIIDKYEKLIIHKDDYEKFKNSKKKWGIKEKHCKKCGARIKDKKQKICEDCGELIE
ncbi:MAG: hypothetical protein KGD63_15610 [Candidatus Lokiarchaeota archaeon]|nr:hypothetical protein [Candidatus Lokiarchaeota archaeon]